MTYPGGKNGAGVYQTLINLIPPHEVYIEPFLGAGAIIRNKLPAKTNYGIEADPAVIDMWSQRGRQDLLIIKGDGIQFLNEFDFNGNEFVYCDPPYLMETRKSGKLYNFEFDTEQHIKLLRTIHDLPCAIMISGYWSELYDSFLKDWSVHSFYAQTRGGTLAKEYVWFNYPEPVRLHDYRYLGKNFRERERIKRKKQRWIAKLANMPMLERRALMNAIDETF